MGLSPLEKRMLIDGARGAVKDYLERGTLDDASSPAQDLSKALREVRGVFVTLYHAGKSRGCMGMPFAILPLWQACRFCALSAACRDPRFPPLAVEDLAEITFEIALIGETRPFEEVSQIRGGTCGLILQKGFRREVFMPGALQEISGGREEVASILRDTVAIDAESADARETWMVFEVERWNEGDL